MNKISAISLFMIIGFLSCKTSEKGIDKLEIAKQYYKALENADSSEMAVLVSDSIVIRESEADYQEEFSQKEYVEWLKWDSVFDPTYTILEIDQENGIVKAKISKMDKRIFFLHEEPIVWNEIIRFDNYKINSVERIKYEVFNVSKFIENRDGLVSWIKEYQPELDGFLNDQTKSGGMKYLKAIELYKSKKQPATTKWQ